MTRGGARVRSGPGADPNAIRRDQDHLAFEALPAAGRQGEAPPWPLSPRATGRERILWGEEWRRPQAVAWQARGQEIEVAIYVRTLRIAERPRATAAILAEIRRQRDALGLTANGMKALRWIIETQAETRRDRATGTEGKTAARWKPEVIDGGS
jgi:hypothetical protein